MIFDNITTDSELLRKKYYARRLFALPVEQIKAFDELTPEQKERVYHYFGKFNPGQYFYAIKKNGELVWNRELIRPEWL